jgi:hypothetical protein
MENVENLSDEELTTVRFAKGTFPPKGRMYYITYVPEKFDIKPAIISGIKNTTRDMLTIPIPMFGIKGIRFLAKRMRKWPARYGEKLAIQNLGQVVRMLEEIGTGGAGFRFIYAAFLQESAGILNKPWLFKVSGDMTVVGDLWREFAVLAARRFKNRDKNGITYDDLADKLNHIADMEEQVFLQLRNIDN